MIVQGHGDLVVDSGRRPVWSGMVIQFEPFETHHLENTGEDDLLFATFYWRDAPRAARVAAKPGRRRFDQRPIFVFSSPTTPNGDLHLGHLSGPYLGADVYTRFQRMNGARVWHIAGSDDFQSYVAGTARSEGRTPAETAAHYSAEILATHKLMDIGVDHYTVSDQDAGYVDGVRDFFARVATSPFVSVADGDALFDGESGQYLYEVDVTGSCPTCGRVIAEPAKVPWHFKLLVVATILYLGYRAWQGFVLAEEHGVLLYVLLALAALAAGAWALIRRSHRDRAA